MPTTAPWPGRCSTPRPARASRDAASGPCRPIRCACPTRRRPSPSASRWWRAGWSPRPTMTARWAWTWSAGSRPRSRRRRKAPSLRRAWSWPTCPASWCASAASCARARAKAAWSWTTPSRSRGGRIMALTHSRNLAILGAVAAGGALLLAARPASAQECTRQVLKDTAEDYISAQETADPTYLHFGLWVDYNEQLQNATLSTGVLSKPMKVDFHRELLDTTACKIFSEVVISDPAAPYVIGRVITNGGGPGATGPDFVGGMSSVVTDKANGWLFDPA